MVVYTANYECYVQLLHCITIIACQIPACSLNLVSLLLFPVCLSTLVAYEYDSGVLTVKTE